MARLNIEGASSDYVITPDVLLLKYVFEFLEDGTRLCINQGEVQGIFGFNFIWNTIRIALLEKMEKGTDEDRTSLAELIETAEGLFDEANALVLPSRTPNPVVREREDIERIHKLKLKILDVHSIIVAGLKESGMWFKKLDRLPPGKAINAKFRM